MNLDQQVVDRYEWWASLKHGGLLISPSKLAEFFPETIGPLPRHISDQLRRDVTRGSDGEDKYISALLDTVLEEVLGLRKEWWLKGNTVDSSWSQRAITREVIKPRRVWLSPNGAVLPVFVGGADVHGQEKRDSITRIGVGRGRRSVSRVIEWLRKANQKIALLTNGRQWRLIHAGADFDAWSEWDIDLWFQEGVPGSQVTALRILLGAVSLDPIKIGETSPLISAIQASRKSQAELSGVLGERVRQAVELLIQESVEAIQELNSAEVEQVTPRDLYIAATRIIMRCVVILFAEARDLLPRDNPIYHSSYGIQGLREQLDRFASGRALERLRHSYSAWPRLLALFRLVYEGSAHQALPVPRYSGGLFAPGDKNSSDPLRRALSAFEIPQHAPSDAVVYRILELLTRSRVKVRQGRISKWVEAPVDFSDLSSEYIGILYEGLLDYELRRAEADNPIVFLNIGDQPALPLPRLETMDDAALSSLVEKLKQTTKAKVGDGEEESDDDSAEEVGEDAEGLGEDSDEEELIEPEPTEIIFEDDRVEQLRERARRWAVRAVKAGVLVPLPRGRRKQEALDEYERAVSETAKSLIFRVVLPGEWFLVRWGSTRKGSGTFYTRPQLAIPTTQRTLRPLAYDATPAGGEAGSDSNVQTEWTPKKPEEILALKVCDPAMGSGSFLVGALRFLTDALFESLHYHGRIQEHETRTLRQILYDESIASPEDERLPVPSTHEEFENRLKARLKRYIVEQCIYGVDNDPLAVELARLSMWVETMDRALPFGFLDHKLKFGNALVGCWFDRFKDYPVLAWEREGGDKNHDRFVHHFREYLATRGKNAGKTVRTGDVWTQAIKDKKNEIIKPEMVAYIVSGEQHAFDFKSGGYTESGLHDVALAVFENLHKLPVHDTEKRAELYDVEFVKFEPLRQLKVAFDTWCAAWFWPGDALDLAVTPENFHDTSEETRQIVTELAAQYGFFHWEIEFPDVFAKEDAGFDAIIGNPPWEIQKPNSMEFFSNIDPLYRTYGKQDALRHQVEYFEKSEEIERNWLAYNARLKALSNWVKHAGHPFGDEASGGAGFNFVRAKKENVSLHNSWRRQRSKRHGYADPQHPFRYQGSADINTYKMFAELAHALLRENGRLGIIMPSGIYTDKGSTVLRRLFLSRCRWEWLFGIINWNKIFESIYYRFKFCIVIAQKGGATSEISSAFSRYHIEEWEEAERYVVPYPRNLLEKFSPSSLALLEFRSEQDLYVLSKVQNKSVPLGTLVEFTQQFDMTGDSKLFPSVPRWREHGFQPNEYGIWQGPEKEIAVPMLEGRMISQFDPSDKGWVSGKGRTAEWTEVPWDNKVLKPQYLMSWDTYLKSRHRIREYTLAYMKISSATNARSFISTVIRDNPSVYSLCLLVRQSYSISEWLNLSACLNSFVYDFCLRLRLGGLNITGYVLRDTPVLPGATVFPEELSLYAANLSFPHLRFAEEWLQLNEEKNCSLTNEVWQSHWSISKSERLRKRVICDAVIAELYNLNTEDFGWILRDCDYAVEQLRDKSFYRTLDPKGFWRVDKEIEPELRHTILSLIAFHDLKRIGLEEFLSQNDGDGWKLPETLCLADYGLGHDERAERPQPVALRLGPRFLPWQLQGTPEDSWEECRRHAEMLTYLLGNDVTEAGENGLIEQSPAAPTNLFGEPLPTDIFGNVITARGKRKR
jgi:hypothetical protein